MLFRSWLNGQYIARMEIADLAAAVAPLFADAGLAVPSDDEWFQKLLGLLRPRAKRLTEFIDLARPFVEDAVQYEPDAVKKHLADPGLGAHVEALAAALRATDPFTESVVEETLRRIAGERQVKAGALIHATRVAVTGRTASPGIFEVLVLLGRDRTVRRLERLVEFLSGPRS